MVTGDTKKRLDIERIRTIKEQTQVIMTLHGASGTDDGDLRRRAIAAGITVIRAIMDKEAGHIVETAVEARAGFIDRPTTVVLIVSTTLKSQSLPRSILVSSPGKPLQGIGATCASANPRAGICRGVRRELTPCYRGRPRLLTALRMAPRHASFLWLSHAGRLCRERRHRAINRRLNHR